MQAEGSSSGSESDRDDTWDDFAADGDDQPATSLFDGQQFSSAQEALQHDKQVHGVDLPLLAATLGKLPGLGLPETAPTDGMILEDRLFRANPSHQLDQADGRVVLGLDARDRMLTRNR